MSDYRLPPTSLNRALQIVKERGLNPAEFQRDEVNKIAAGIAYPFTRFVHIPTGYFFVFSGRMYTNGMRLRVDFSPPNEDGQTEVFCESRNHQMNEFANWANTVRAEHEAPDLWAEAAREPNVLTGEVVDGDDQPFTVAERTKLLEGLEQLKTRLIAESAKTPQQVGFININIAYLGQKSEHLPKSLWKNVFTGVLVKVISALALSSTAIHRVLTFASELILPVLGQLHLPNLLP